MQERRRSARLGLRLAATLKDPGSAAVHRALTKDISGHGMCVLTPGPLTPGTRLEVEIELRGLKAPITFETEVVWSRPVAHPVQGAHGLSAETGVRFVRIDPKDRTLIMLYARLHTVPPPSVAP